MNTNSTQKYSSIMYQPHHCSAKRQPMSREMRAAQFAPFAALTGYDSAISETARLTDKRIELDEETAAELNLAIMRLNDKIRERPSVRLCRFVADLHKKGGSYTNEAGVLRAIDFVNRVFIFVDGRKINIDDVVSIEEQ